MKSFSQWLVENESPEKLFVPGYAKSDYTEGLPQLSQKKPETSEEWLQWFETRAEQLQKSRRSMYVDLNNPDNVIDKARKLITGEEKLLPYTDMYTSTAGFQWGKEFLDILAHEGLFNVVKRGNKVYAELALPQDLKDELYKKFRGTVAGKKYGI